MSDEIEELDENVAVARPIGFLPWHDGAIAHLQTALAGNRLPHGLLLHGPRGVGKEVFASAFAAALFCTHRGEALVACGACPECLLSRAGTHPDLHWVTLLKDAKGEKEKKAVGVDQIRRLSELLGMTSMRSGYRVAVIEPAETMTVPAQNALLKTLEEPAPRTVLMLVTARPSGLLATLRSRCQRIEIPRPAPELALPWIETMVGGPVPERLLALAGGAPLRAVALAPYFDDLERQMSGLLEALVTGRAEVTRLAADMQGEGLPTRLDWLEAWLGRLIRGRMPGNETSLTLPGGALLQRTSAAVNITMAFRLVDQLREARRLLEGNAAPLLVVEALLVELRTACAA
ncbi:MAG TPA: DNA polymerase III subunit delta' [Steroidobacteraceae bacterium]